VSSHGVSEIFFIIECALATHTSLDLASPLLEQTNVMPCPVCRYTGRGCLDGVFEGLKNGIPVEPDGGPDTDYGNFPGVDH
jgi:hypothetical protein